MKIKNRIREGSRIADVIMYAIAVFLVFITVYPMYYVLILSLSDPRWAMTMRVYTVPKGFDFHSYGLLLQDMKMWRAYMNTIIYAAVTTVLMLVTSFIGAYPLTYKSLMGRKYLNMFLLITMFFSGGLIPSFLLINRLGMYDSPLAIIIPSCFSVWNIILVKAYLSTISESLREAARIDGASVEQIMVRIYFPLSSPILAVIAVYTIVGVWNSWFGALVYLPSLKWQPLQIFLRRMLVTATTPTKAMSPDQAKAMAALQLSYAQIKYAMIIFSSLPVLLTYPFFQKYFMKGIMLGSLKE